MVQGQILPSGENKCRAGVNIANVREQLTVQGQIWLSSKSGIAVEVEVRPYTEEH
jgi:hypothetical protein